MVEKIDLESVAKDFDQFLRTSSLSRADSLFLESDTIYIIEDTNCYAVDLLDERVFEEFVAEIVKKMWGSLTILLWWARENLENLKGKKRVFILNLGVDEKTARMIPLIICELNKYRNGAYEEIQYEGV